MVSIVFMGNTVNQDVWDIRGLSTDTKPLGNVPNSSTFLEMDTKAVFIFDEENQRWLPLQ